MTAHPFAEVVVVGAGLAGLRTIEALRRRGFTGSITLVGNEPEPPYDRPPLSKAVLAGTVDDESVLLATGPRLAELGVTWLAGRTATGLDVAGHQVRLDDGSLAGYGRLVVATGATPREFPDMRSLAGIHVLRTLEDARRLRAAATIAHTVCVLGGGVLGCEIAATLSVAVASTTIIEAAPALLSRALPAGAVASAIARMHDAAGVVVRVDAPVRALHGDTRVRAVELADGSEVAADLVVVALGVLPAVDWLVGSGLDLLNGVVCDPYLRTGNVDVFAVGDVANKVDPTSGAGERAEHWTSAVEQADIAARNLLATPGTLVAHTTVPYVWSDQFDRKLQILGRPVPADEEHVVRDDRDERRAFALYAREGVLVGAAGLGTARDVVRARALLATSTSLREAVAAY